MRLSRLFLRRPSWSVLVVASTRRAIVLLVLCALLAVGNATAWHLFPQPLKWIRGHGDGIATADLNNDGLPDVIAADNSDRAHVYLGNGDGSFTVLEPIVTDDQPTFVAVADFDFDGNLDLALAKYDGVMGVSVLMGNGDGTFGPETDYPGGQMDTVSAGDFNGDDVPDLLAMAGGNNLFLGDGSGGFDSFQVPGQWYFAGVADFDGDDLDDYAYPRPGTDSVVIELSNGDGSFTEVASLNVGDDPRGVTAGDVSGDGVQDLIVTNGSSDDVSVLLGGGDGSFGPEHRHSLGVPPEDFVEPWYAAIHDLDGDGLQDLVVSNWWGGGANPSLSLLYGSGGGQFSAAVAGDMMLSTSHGVALADFNGDGAIDLVRADRGRAMVSWLYGDGQGAFVTNRQEDVGDSPSAIAVGDLDGDGREDLVTANIDTDDLSVLLADGAGTFAPEQRFCVVAATAPCPAGSDPSAVAIGEMTGDVHLDLAVANTGSNTISILIGDGAGGFSFTTHLAVNPGMAPSSIAMGDLDDDDDEDLVVVGEGSNVLAVFLGNGDGTFGTPLGGPIGLGVVPASVALGDIDGDDYLDAAVAHLVLGFGRVAVLLGNGDGTFTAGPTVDAGSSPTDVTLGDVSGDQIVDLVVANDGPGDNSLHVRSGNGDGTFGSPTILDGIRSTAHSDGPHRVRIADLDGDGHQDLATVTRDLCVFPGDGEGAFGESQWYRLDGTRFAMGDFNLDSRLDVAGVKNRCTILLSQSGPNAFGFEADRATLSWPAVTGTLKYNLYRGNLSDLVDDDDDGLPDSGYGTCMTSLDDDPRDTFFEDASVPSPAGAGFFYLMSVVDSGGDGGIGTTSAGLPRTPGVPCP